MENSDPSPAELRAQIDELQREKAWTEEQHRRWVEERHALLEQIREQRISENWKQERPELLATIEKYKAWANDLEKARQAWQVERQGLLNAIAQLKAPKRAWWR